MKTRNARILFIGAGIAVVSVVALAGYKLFAGCLGFNMIQTALCVLLLEALAALLVPMGVYYIMTYPDGFKKIEEPSDRYTPEPEDDFEDDEENYELDDDLFDELSEEEIFEQFCEWQHEVKLNRAINRGSGSGSLFGDIEYEYPVGFNPFYGVYDDDYYGPRFLSDKTLKRFDDSFFLSYSTDKNFRKIPWEDVYYRIR